MRPAPLAARRPARLAIAALVLTAALLSGCGDDDKVVVRTVTVHGDAPSSSGSDADADPSGEDAEATTGTAGTSPPAKQGAASGGFTRCDANITAKAGTTTCAFATNAFYEYWTGNQAGRIKVYSPAAQRVLSADCRSAGGEVACTTSDGGVTRFSQAAVDRYTQAQADAYAADHDIGSTASAGGGTPAQTP